MPQVTKAMREMEKHNAYEQGYKNGFIAGKAEAFHSVKTSPTVRDAQIRLMSVIGQTIESLSHLFDNSPKDS